MSYQVALTQKSGNAKTGPIPVSTTTFNTCPDSCPFRKHGCYADSGPLNLHWKAVTEERRGVAWEIFTKQISLLPEGTFWRHNQAGDLPGNRITIDQKALQQLVDANKGKMGFTYTHYDVIANGANREAVKGACEEGFVVNLSGNNLSHADKLKALGIAPVTVVLPSTVEGKAEITTPAGNKVVVCPATYKDDVSCDTCRLCARKRDVIVGFPAHGTTKKKADVVAA
jgi:hypothetical protein